MRLSSPNAIKVTLPAAMPEATATVASTAIQPTVSHSSRNACRISLCRWGSTASKSASSCCLGQKAACTR